jgi:hypothetical protein
MKLRVRALGMAAGIVWGLEVFLATIWLIWFGGTGASIQLLKSFYLGYDVTYVGAFLGLIWGFVDGFIAGALVAWLYNLFHKAFYKSQPTS